MPFRWEQDPIIQASDIIRRILRRTSLFGLESSDSQRIFLALNEAEVHAISIEQFPYAAIVNQGTDYDFNERANDRVIRVNDDWELYAIVGRDEGPRRDGARSSVINGLAATKALRCAVDGWVPNRRYRPVQAIDEDWVGYASSERVMRVVTARFSYITRRGEECPPPECVKLTGVDIKFRDAQDTDEGVLPPPVNRDFTITQPTRAR